MLLIVISHLITASRFCYISFVIPVRPFVNIINSMVLFRYKSQGTEKISLIVLEDIKRDEISPHF